MNRRWKLIWTAVFLAALACLCDTFGLFDRAPEAAKLSHELSHRVRELRTYRCDITISHHSAARSGSSGGREWCGPDGLHFLRAKDEFGVFHLERWTGSTWTYFQSGAGFEVRTELRNYGRLPFQQWLMTGFPTLSDLTHVLQSAPQVRSAAGEATSAGAAWVLELSPPVPSGGNAPLPILPWTYGTDFYRDLFGRRWRIWLSDRTRLPMRVIIDRGPADALVAEFSEITPAPLPAGERWEELYAGDTRVRERFALGVDADAPASYVHAREQLMRRVNNWRRSLFAPRRVGAPSL